MDLSHLNPRQREAVDAIDGPVLVLAGAGTGKTTVITCRIAAMLESGLRARELLAVTFTNKAAREMKERLRRILPRRHSDELTVSTFHAFCCRLLRSEIQHLGYDPRFGIADDGDQDGIVKEIVNKRFPKQQPGYEVAAFRSRISRAKNHLQSPDDIAALGTGLEDEILAAVYSRYQQQLQNMNLLDFDDLLYLTVRLWRERKEILGRYRDRFRYLLVDEFQDTNVAQAELVRLLATPRNNLCVVGDDDQSIYSWRGANPENILAFDQAYPGTRIVRLEQNYRSTNTILRAANALIANNAARHNKQLWSRKGDGERIRLLETDSEIEESRTVVRFAEEYRFSHKLAYSDMAILCRANHQTRLFEQSLRERNVPYRLVGAKSFYERREIKDALAYLRIVANPADDLALLRVLNVPPRGLGPASIARLRERAAATGRPLTEAIADAELLSHSRGTSAAQLQRFAEARRRARNATAQPGRLADKIHAYFNDIDYLPGLGRVYKRPNEAIDRRDNVIEFINAIAQFEEQATGSPSLEDVLERFSLSDDHDKEEKEGADGVTIMTVHAAKGLEFPMVYVVGAEQEIFPHERSIRLKQLDEERRLFYVAVTRARELLVISRAKNRTRFGKRARMRPSQFLGELPAALVETVTPETAFQPATEETVDDAIADLLAAFND